MRTNKDHGTRRSDATVATGQRENSPGKHTLTEAISPTQPETGDVGSVANLAATPVQRKASGAAPVDIHVAAQRGVAGPGQALPHGDRIQSLFGRHDVSGIQAHVGGAAAEASDRIGAAAYATGSSVAFREAPDLHTAAHEAAHVVQQRGGVQLRGGVGEHGDAYERHADAVSDAVVAGQPAGALLDQMAGPSAAGPAPSGGVQRKPPDGAIIGGLIGGVGGAIVGGLVGGVPGAIVGGLAGGLIGAAVGSALSGGGAVGTNKKTDFGEYWVVPDGTQPAAAKVGQKGESITQSAFTALEAAWNKVKDGTGKLVITETDKTGGAHAGFKASVLPRIGMLMSRPRGRELITGLVNGAKQCTIRPAPGKIFGGAETNAAGGLGAGAPGVKTNGVAGAGADSFVDLDANVGDNDIKVHDAAGNDIDDPVYIFLGHELIHARHISAGEVDMGAPTDASYGIKEEETTIATGGLNENDLRAEHGLTLRHDHGGSDSRP